MGIESIKRWQWILIGLLAGLGLGYVWTGADPTDDSGRQISQIDFERDLMRKHPKTREPMIRNIVIRPAVVDYQGKQVQPVTFERLYQGGKSGKTYYQPGQFIAAIPYKPILNIPQPPRPDLKVRDYLAEVAKKLDTVKFSYGWWNEKPASLALWTAGSAVVIGGIWPTLLNLIIGAGFGGPPRQTKEAKKKEEYDLSRFGKSPEPEAPAIAKPVIDDAQRQRLDDINANLEAQLKSAGALGDASAGDATENSEGSTLTPVRKLDGGPVEQVKPIARPGDDDDIEVKGEFYPVLIHHQKKAEGKNTKDEKPQEPRSQ